MRGTRPSGLLRTLFLLFLCLDGSLHSVAGLSVDTTLGGTSRTQRFKAANVRSGCVDCTKSDSYVKCVSAGHCSQVEFFNLLCGNSFVCALAESVMETDGCLAGYGADALGRCVACEQGHTFQPDDGSRHPCSPCTTCGSFILESSCTVVKDTECNCPDGEGVDSSTDLCSSCPAGTYSSGSLLCQQCPPGKFQDEAAQSYCDECPAGTFTNAPGEYGCSPCARGYYSEENATVECKPCAAGTYTDSLATVTCSACGTNEDSVKASSSCSCSAGYYDDGTGCASCEEGKYKDQLGSAGCTACSAGTYQGGTSATSCTFCSQGTYSDGQGSQACISCSGGQTSDATRTGCQKCTKGYYSSETNTTCIPCPAGTFSVDEGVTQCNVCPSPTYASDEGSTACIDCGTNSMPDGNSAACVGCDPGTHRSDGESTCTPCGKGTYGLDGYGNGCNTCGKGFYQDEDGQLSCKRCEAGTYGSAEGLSACSECSVGKFSNEGEEECLDCDAGTYADTVSSVSCTECETGKYQPFIGHTKCDSCSAGTYMDEPGSIGCRACFAGYFSESNGLAACVICPKGGYSDERGLSKCKGCIDGTITLFEGATSSESCVKCQDGYYPDSASESGCVACAANAVSKAGDSQCTTCTDATIAATSTCKSVPLGWKTDDNIAMSACKIYEYGSSSNKCDQCPGGTYTDATGQTACKKCPKGYAKNEGEDACSKCGDFPGKYASEEGMTACSQCDDEGKGPNDDFTDCIDCKAGFFSQQVDGGRNCTICDDGTYSDESGQTKCKECGLMKVVNADRTECKACVEGKSYNIEEGKCFEDCPENTNQRRNDTTGVCSYCPDGTYVGSHHETTCEKCEEGKALDNTLYINSTFLTFSYVCPDCQIGTYSNETGRSSCTMCALGTFGDEAGLPSCKSCVVGTYGRMLGQSSCEDCDYGYYQASSGSTSCESCKTNQTGSCPLTTRQKKSSSKEFCVPGCGPGLYYSISKGTPNADGTCGSDEEAECILCEEGTYSDGFLTRTTDKTDTCTVCPAGTYGDIAGMKSAQQCKNCTSGYYQPPETIDVTGVGRCVSCDGLGVQQFSQKGYFSGYYTTNNICHPCEFQDVVLLRAGCANGASMYVAAIVASLAITIDFIALCVHNIGKFQTDRSREELSVDPDKVIMSAGLKEGKALRKMGDMNARSKTTVTVLAIVSMLMANYAIFDSGKTAGKTATLVDVPSLLAYGSFMLAMLVVFDLMSFGQLNAFDDINIGANFDSKKKKDSNVDLQAAALEEDIGDEEENFIADNNDVGAGNLLVAGLGHSFQLDAIRERFGGLLASMAPQT